MVGQDGGLCSYRARGLVEVGEIVPGCWAIQYGLLQSSYHFYGILERYNPLTGTFFTLVGEMGLVLHELYEISELVIGDALYEEYVLTTEGLHLLKKKGSLVYETYWEV